MKKLFILCLFLVAILGITSALYAELATSYNPNAPFTANQSIAREIKAKYARTGSLTAYEQRAINEYQVSSTKVFTAPTTGTRDTHTAYPQSVSYWTGSTTSAAKTETSLVKGYNTEDGWFKFDISALPIGATINSVTFNGYVYDNSWPYWSITPVTVDPVSATAADLFADINAEATTGYYLYRNESGTITNGWIQHVLGGNVNTDLSNAIAQGWFAIGVASRDNVTGYYINFQGWNEANIPYLTIDYTPPVPGPVLQAGIVFPATGNTLTNFAYSVQYLHTEGTAPVSAKVYIRPDALSAWTDYNLVYPTGTPDYTLWQTFTYTTTLALGTDYEYYFEFDDGVTRAVAVFPTTAPGTPASGPDVYTPISGTLEINAAGGGDYLSFAECFADLNLRGTDGNTVNVEVYGNYAASDPILGNVPGANASGWINFYPAVGETVTITGTGGTTSAPLRTFGASYVSFTGFNLTGGGNAGIIIDDSHHIKISHCNIYTNGWLGLSIKSGSNNVTAWNNFIWGNFTQQIALYDNGIDCDIALYNNSVYADGATGAEYHTGMTLSNSEVAAYNNIIHRNWNGGNAFSVVHVQSQDWTTHPNTLLDYNVYHNQDGSTIFPTFATLADWQASGAGQDANSLQGNPYYINGPAGDLHIVIGASPAYQNGIDLALMGVVDDFDGDLRTINPLYDIGADVIVPVAYPAPVDQVVTNLTHNTATLGWTEAGTATTWDIEWGESGFTPGEGTLITATTTRPFPLSDLTPSTPYQWYVRSNYDDLEYSPWAGPHTFTTQMTPFPVDTENYVQNFDSVVVPAMPTGWTIVNANSDGVMWVTNASYPRSAPNSMFISYNSSLAMNDYAFTPPLALTGGVTYEVEYYYRNSGTTYPEKLRVMMGQAPTAAGMTTLVLDNGTFQSATYLRGYATFVPATTGTYYLGWHGYSAADMYYICVDDITIKPAPLEALPATDPIPANNALNQSRDVNLGWTNNGSVAFVDVYFGTSEAGVTAMEVEYRVATNQASPLNSFDLPQLVYGQQYWWMVVPKNAAYEAAVGNLVWNFTVKNDPTIYPGPVAYVQNFDDAWTGSPAAPLNWTVINVDGSYTWRQGNTYITPTHSLPYSAYGSGNANDWLITPLIDQTSTVGKISWWDKVESASYPNTYTVYVSVSDPTVGSFTENLGTYTCTNTDWTQHTLFLDAYAGERIYVGFHQTFSQSASWGFGIDTVEISQVLMNDLAATDIVGPTWGFAGDDMDFEVTIYNNGLNGMADYTVKLFSVDTREELASIDIAEELPSGDITSHILTWENAPQGLYSIYGQVSHRDDENDLNDETGEIQVKIYSATSYLPFIGDEFSSTATLEVPMNVYYEKSLTETIYRAAEMQMTAGMINGMVWYNAFDTDFSKPIQVWVKNTTDADLSTGWQDFTGYDLVFDGTVHFPSGYDIVHVPFISPFEYTGGNLAIRVHHVWQDQYWSQYDQFFYTDSPEFPNRSRYYYVDGDGPLDPINVLDEYGDPIPGTLSNKIPLTTFIVDPATPVSALDTPVVTISNVGANVELSWPAVPGAYAYRIYATNDLDNWPVDPVVSVRGNTYQEVAGDKGFYKVVAVSTFRNQNLGVIANPANRAGALVPARKQIVEPKKK